MTFNPKNPEWLNRDRFVLSYVILKTSALELFSRSIALFWIHGH
jgi:transketolase